MKDSQQSNEGMKPHQGAAFVLSCFSPVFLTSPGFVELPGTLCRVIAAIALIVFINGGELKIRKGKFELDLCSEGLIGGLNEYFNSKQDKKIKEILMSKIKELKDADNVVKTLAEINRENQNE